MIHKSFLLTAKTISLSYYPKDKIISDSKTGARLFEVGTIATILALLTVFVLSGMPKLGEAAAAANVTLPFSY